MMIVLKKEKTVRLLDIYNKKRLMIPTIPKKNYGKKEGRESKKKILSLLFFFIFRDYIMDPLKK